MTMTDIVQRLTIAVDECAWEDEDLRDLLRDARDELRRRRPLDERLDKIETLIKRNGT
jgi:hypothetical protein